MKLRSALLVAALLLILPAASAAYDTFCEDCYIKHVVFTNQAGSEIEWTYAMCCVTDMACPADGNSEWYQVVSSAEYCSIGSNDQGEYCNFTGSCGGGGDDGDGDWQDGNPNCTIGPADVCPAECSTCDREPFYVM